MQLQRPARARAVDDASAVVVSSGRISVPKLAVLSTDKHAPPLADIEKEGGGSSSLGLKISPQKSRTCLPRKEKIEALKGLGIGSFVGGARNLSSSKSKPKSATSLSSTKWKSSNVTCSKNQARLEVYLVILPPFDPFFFSLFFVSFFF